MQINLYYRAVFQRRNALKDFLLGIFDSFSSYPKMILEVFIRKNFGERYFNLASAITITIILILFPVLAYRIKVAYLDLRNYGGYSDGGDFTNFWIKYVGWYLFTIAFLLVSIKRWEEVRRNPSVFDTERFSKYSGDIHPMFFTAPIFKKTPSVRHVEILYEPAFFLIIGLLLWLMGQSLGPLFIISSIFYSLSNSYAYMVGDDFVIDILDKIILNRDMKENFSKNTNDGERRGVRYRLRKPNNVEDRDAFVNAVIVEDDDVAVAI